MDIFLLKVSLRTDVIISRCGGNSNHQCSSVCLQNPHPPSSFILRLLSFSACFILCPRFERISISKCYSKDNFDLNYNLDYTGNNKPLKFSSRETRDEKRCQSKTLGMGWRKLIGNWDSLLHFPEFFKNIFNTVISSFWYCFIMCFFDICLALLMS